MSLEGKRINELTEVSKVDTSSKLVIDTGGAEALSITLKNLIDSSGASSVDIATTEKAGIVKPDGTTISVSSDGTISFSGSGFDFEGTKAEFDAAVAAGTITADSVSLITDDVDGANVATKAELQAVESEANNLTNLTVQGKSLVSVLGMPSDRYIDLTIGADGATYTAPANGWFWCGGIADNVQQNTRIVLRIIKNKFGMTSNTNGTTASGGFVGAFLPVAQGEIVGLYYVNITADYGLRFFYAEGSKPEQ